MKLNEIKIVIGDKIYKQFIYISYQHLSGKFFRLQTYFQTLISAKK
jgi:hypothetical protein